MVSLEERRHAKRFPIMASIVFRQRGETAWRAGSTLNLSHMGVLFQTEALLPGTGQAVDFVIGLPLNDETPPTEVWCTGHVARHELGETGRSVAVTIDHYVLGGHSTA